ncbi:MAG: FadR family transcriptional regulator [Sphingomonadales bacterium]|nr:FadR family transcriptional regulator [Sphingomonadales bacterium]
MKAVESKGLHGRVIQDLGQAILSGEFAPGATLPGQEECCARLGVSRTVLREALRVLAAKGLVDARPKAGTFVLPRENWNFLDPDILEWRLRSEDRDAVLEQLYELRHMVEPTAAFLAASRAKLQDFRRMGEAFDAMAAAGRTHDSIESDLAFHRAIIEASGNDLFASLGRVVESALVISFRIGADNPDGTEHSLAMHKAILDAIVDRNGAEARVAMRKLIDYSKGTVARVSKAKGSEARGQSKR